MKIANLFSRKNRILLGELVKTDFKLKYQGSALGYLWSVIKPLMLFAVIYVVFVNFLRWGSDIPHYAVYLLTGTVLWTFFTEATGLGIQSIVSRGDLLRKINFPKYILVISSTMSALISLAINLCVVLLFALINGVDFHWSILIVPFLIIELYTLALGISFLLGAIYVKYRDISHIWDVVVQALFYATPIIYPLTMVAANSPEIAKLLLLNPIAQIIQDARYLIITHETMTIWNTDMNPILRFVPIIIVAIFVAVASLYFNHHSKTFAENI